MRSKTSKSTKHKTQAHTYNMSFTTQSDISNNNSHGLEQNGSYSVWTQQDPFDVKSNFEIWSTSQMAQPYTASSSRQATPGGDSDVHLNFHGLIPADWYADAAWNTRHSYVNVDDTLEPWKRHLLLLCKQSDILSSAGMCLPS